MVLRRLRCKRTQPLIFRCHRICRSMHPNSFQAIFYRHNNHRRQSHQRPMKICLTRMHHRRFRMHKLFRGMHRIRSTCLSTLNSYRIHWPVLHCVHIWIESWLPMVWCVHMVHRVFTNTVIYVTFVVNIVCIQLMTINAVNIKAYVLWFLVWICNFNVLFLIFFFFKHRNVWFYSKRICNCRSLWQNQKTKHVAFASRWLPRKWIENIVSVYCPIVIIFSVCNAFENGVKPKISTVQSHGESFFSYSRNQNTYCNWMYVFQSMSRMSSNIELCVPEFVLGWHKGRERFIANGIQRSSRSTKLQIFQ